MPRFDDIRNAFAGARDLSDEAILRKMQEITSLPLEQVANDFGYDNKKSSLTRERIGGAVDSYQSNLYGTAGAVARGLGLSSESMDRRRDDNKLQADVAGARAKSLGGIDDFRDVSGVGSGLNYLGGLAAQSLPYAGEALVGGLTGGIGFTGTAARLGLSAAAARTAARTAGATAAGYPSAVGDILSNQREENGTENLGSALAGGVPYALANSMFGIEGAVARGGLARNTVNLLDNIGKGGFAARTAATAGKTALTEGASETAQELINQGFGRMAVNPEQTLFNEEANKRYLDSFVGGAALGGVFGSVGGGRRSAGYVDPNASKDLLDPEAPQAPKAPGLNRVYDAANEPLSDVINQNTGVGLQRYAGNDYAAQFEAAAAAPTGQQVMGADGIEAPDTALDNVQRQAGILTEEQQRAQAIKAKADEVAADVKSRQNRMATLGLNAKGSTVYDAFKELEDAHADGAIDDVMLAENLGLLKAGKTGSVRKFVKGVYAQQDATATADEQTKQTNLAAVQPKAPDAKTPVASASNVAVGANAGPTTAATPAGAAPKQPSQQPATAVNAAPAAPAGPVGPVSQGNGAVADAAQPAVRGAQPVKPEGTPAVRAAALLEKLGVPADRELEVTRAGKKVKVKALENWTKLLANPLALKRAQQAAGADAEWNVVNSPMSFAAIADAEGVSRAAVSKQLLGFGVSEKAVSTAVATDTALDSRAGATFEEAPDQTGIVAVPKVSDITATDGEILPQAPRGSERGTFGVREETSLSKAAGEGLVRGAPETRDQREARVRADDLLRASVPTAQSVEDARQELENRRRAEAQYDAVLKTPQADEARIDWNDGKQEGSPTYEELVPRARQAWVLTHYEFTQENGNDWGGLQSFIQRFEKELDESDYQKVSSNDAVSSPAARVRESAPAAATEHTTGDGGAAAPVQSSAGGQVSGTAPVVVTKKRRVIQRSDGAPNSRGTSDAKQLTAEFTKFLRVGSLGRLINVVQSVSDLPFAPGEAKSVGINERTQGFVMGGKAYFIADNIAAGKGRAVFMHEVGSHLGVQELLAEGEFKKLVSTVMGWAGGKAGPEAQKIARAAMSRVTAANTSAAQYNTELVAYAIEEAMLAGYNPSAAGNEGPIKAWMRAVVTQVKNLLTKLGVNADKFNVQDLVDLAYGAARAVQVMDAQEMADGVQQSAVQFSQAMPNTPQGKAITKSHTRMSESWLDMTDTASEGFNWALKRAVFTKDLVALAVKGGLSSASGYFDKMNAVTVEKLKSERAVSDVLEAFRQLPAREQGTGAGTVNSLLKDSTEKKLWAYQPTWLETVKVDPALAARYKALSPAAQKVLDGVFKHGNDNRAELIKAKKVDVAAQFADDMAAAKTPEAKAAVEKEINKAVAAATDGLAGNWPYAPLSRYGNYVVLAMSAKYLEAHRNKDTATMQELQSDEAHYRVERVDTMRASRRLRDSLDSAFPGGYVDNFEKPVEDSLVYGGRDALGSLRRLRTLIKDSAEDADGIDKAAAASLDKVMRDLHLTLLAETSARKSQLKRKTTAGADEDMMRSFAGQGRAMAHYIAALKTGSGVQDTLQAMRDQARDKVPGREGRQAYYNEILRRHVQQLDYQPSPFIDKAMSVTSIWMLLTNPAHQLMNLLQPAMMSQPLLAAKHGYGRSGASMIRAYRDLGPMLAAGGLTEKNYEKLPKDVRAAIEELANRGVIDISLAQDLGEFRSSGGGAGELFSTVVKKLRDVSENVEAVNRLSTAMSAYRLEKERFATDAAAIDYAAKVIYESHGDYSGFNAPRYMRQGVFRLATQFRKFQLIQLSMYARLLNDSFKGASPEERAVARKALAFNLGHLFAMGGAMAMPGFAAVSWLLTKVFGSEDEPDDTEAQLRRAVDNKGLADFLLRGAPKFAGVDISDRVGAGGMLSLLPYAEGGLDRKGYESALLGLAGPFLGGLMPRTLDGVGLMSQSMRNGQAMDFYKGMELLMPNGVTNLMKAARYQTEGISQRNGDIVLPAEDLGFLESFGQALGLPGNAVTDRNFLNQSKRTADEFYKGRTADIKREYVGAFRDNDADVLRATREEWLTLQKGRQRLGYEVQPLSVLLKAPQEVRKREQSAVRGVAVKDRDEGFVDALTRE